MAPSFQGPLLSYAIAGLAVAALFGNCESAIGQNSDARFLAPPRTIADITAILDQEKPDSQRLAKLRAEGEAAPPKGADRGTLATFHFKRAQARTELGRMRDATADTEKAIELGRGQGVDVSRFKQFYQMQLNYLGDPKRRLQVLNELASEVGNQGRRHGVYRQLAETYLQLGDLKQTENYVRLNQARFAESRGFGGFPSSGSGWEANVLQGNARLLEMRGQFREAEVMFRRARAAYQADRAKWTPDRDGGIQGEINEPEEMASVVQNLGRATAKVHCASDEDSDQNLVKFQTEEAIVAAVEGRRKEFVADLTDFGVAYAQRVRKDHALFVEAFREGKIGGVSAT